MENENKTTIELGNGTSIVMDQTPTTHSYCEFCNACVPHFLCRKVLDVPVCIDCLMKEVLKLQNKTTVTVGAQTFTIEHHDMGDFNQVLSDTFMAKLVKGIREVMELHNEVQFKDNVCIWAKKCSISGTNGKVYTFDVLDENSEVEVDYAE